MNRAFGVTCLVVVVAISLIPGQVRCQEVPGIATRDTTADESPPPGAAGQTPARDDSVPTDSGTAAAAADRSLGQADSSAAALQQRIVDLELALARQEAVDDAELQLSSDGFRVKGFPGWFVLILVVVVLVAGYFGLAATANKATNTGAWLVAGLVSVLLVFQIGAWWGRRALQDDLQAFADVNLIRVDPVLEPQTPQPEPLAASMEAPDLPDAGGEQDDDPPLPVFSSGMKWTLILGGLVVVLSSLYVLSALASTWSEVRRQDDKRREDEERRREEREFGRERDREERRYQQERRREEERWREEQRRREERRDEEEHAARLAEEARRRRRRGPGWLGSDPESSS